MAGFRDDELARTATAQPSGAPALPIDAVGPTLGRYRLEHEIGSGGMGAVHAAFDPDLERRIALKVLRASSGGGDAERRLLREARAMARLVHPNVVTVHEVGTVNGRDYIAMELVEGETLAEWLRFERRPEDEIIAAFVGAGRGLAAAHAAGIVHRDFKPHNVLRCRSGRIVVTDFGLAREAQVASSEPRRAPSAAGTPGRGAELAALATGKPGESSATGPTAEGTPQPPAPSESSLAGALSRAQQPAGEGSRNSPLAGLTVTGSLLGTPAYMAPEQWCGGAVTPATDQFGFCVALWEALAGERPFRGATLEELRAEAQRGPGALDASRIPRHLRRVLRRGLDPVPERRWPSMDALLAAMMRARRRGVAIGLVAATLAVAIAIFLAGRSTTPPRPPAPAVCPAPLLDPDAVWSVAKRDQLAAIRRTEARQLDADFGAWRGARERACTGDAVAQTARHACLDAVLVRLDTVARAVEALGPEVPPTDPGAFTIDPVVCEGERIPRLGTMASTQMHEVIATALREEATPGPVARDAAAALVQRVKSEPCAAALARLVFADAARSPSERDPALTEAEQDADRCNDDRVRAEIATAAARHALTGGYLGAAISSKVKLAEVAVDRVAQRDLTAEVDALRLELARRADRLDEAIARGEAAMAGYAARGRIAAQVGIGLRTLDLRDLRARADDVEAVPRLYAEWRTHAARELGAAHPAIRRLDGALAKRMFVRGDVEGGHTLLDKLRQPIPNERVRHLRGLVVDRWNRPVPGATVVAGPELYGDSVSVAVPLPGEAGALRFATTNDAGEFEIADGPEDGVVIAQRGNARSIPIAIADRVTLALAPTSRIEGKVDLRGEPASRVMVTVQDLRLPVGLPYELLAPVNPDGTFALDGAPRGKLRVYAELRKPQLRSVSSTTIDVQAPIVRDVAVAVSAAQSSRVVHVVVRSTVGTPVRNAQVYLFAGHRSSTNMHTMYKDLRGMNYAAARQLESEHAPAAVLARAHAGDMFATMTEVPEGTATACAIGLPQDLADHELERKLLSNLEKISVRCEPIPADAQVVVVEVPPWPRLD